MNPGKMSRVAEVGERLGGGGLERHKWPKVAAGPKLYTTQWLIKNPM